MTVYVDPLSPGPRRNKLGNLWCHMMATSIKELHEFAADIGVRHCWFHGDHYDLNPEQRKTAILAGAQPTTSRHLVVVREVLRCKDPECCGVEPGEGK